MKTIKDTTVFPSVQPGTPCTVDHFLQKRLSVCIQPGERCNKQLLASCLQVAEHCSELVVSSAPGSCCLRSLNRKVLENPSVS